MFTQSQHSYFEIAVLTLSKGLLNISEGLLTMSKLRFYLPPWQNPPKEERFVAIKVKSNKMKIWDFFYAPSPFPSETIEKKRKHLSF